MLSSDRQQPIELTQPIDWLVVVLQASSLAPTKSHKDTAHLTLICFFVLVCVALVHDPTTVPLVTDHASRRASPRPAVTGQRS